MNLPSGNETTGSPHHEGCSTPTCRLCGHGPLRPFYNQGNRDEFTFHRCPNCGLVNYDLGGGLDQLKYASEFVDPFDERHRRNVAQTVTHRFLRRRVPTPGRLLEIGCGNGRLLHLARSGGWEVRGLELSPFLAASVKARLGIDVVVADYMEYSHGTGEAFDLVLLRHVLEHLMDPKRAMMGISALLKEGGYALLEFPNIDGLDTRLKRWLRRAGIYRKKYPETWRPGHCNEYCRRSFEFLLRETGFELVIWETYSYRPFSNFVFNHWHIGNKARAIVRKR